MSCSSLSCFRPSVSAGRECPIRLIKPCSRSQIAHHKLMEDPTPRRDRVAPELILRTRFRSAAAPLTARCSIAIYGLVGCGTIEHQSTESIQTDCPFLLCGSISLLQIPKSDHHSLCEISELMPGLRLDYLRPTNYIRESICDTPFSSWVLHSPRGDSI